MAKSTNRDVVFDIPEQMSSFRPGVNHLLAVGINDYQHVAKLSNAVRDAKCFVELMQDKYNFDAKNTYTLYDKEATKKNIAAVFRDLIERIDAEKDNIVIYFSGHGHYDEVLKEGYWVPVNAKYEAEVDYIPYSYIKNVIRAIPSQHTVMIVDSCYSGSMLMSTRNLNSERFEKDPSRWMVASGRNEVVPDGVIGGNSPFAEKLLSILDRYADEGLRLGTLVEKLTTAVAYNSNQTPIGRPIYEVGDQGGEFFFHPKETVETAWAKAQQANIVEGYTLFLSKHGDSEYAPLAREKVAELQPPAPPADAQAPVAISAVPQAVDQAPDLMDVRSLAAGDITSLPQASLWRMIWQKNKAVITSVVVALMMLTWLGIEYFDTSTGDEEVMVSENALLKWEFAEAEQLALQALSSEPDSEKAATVLNNARSGIQGRNYFQKGNDFLKAKEFAQAIQSFTAAEDIYTKLGYYKGISDCEALIDEAMAKKTDAEIQQAEAEANTQSEREKAHAEGQRKIKALADAYYAKGDYSLAVKEYEKLDNTTNVARDIRMAKLGETGKLPKMIAVNGFSGGKYYISPYEITNAQYCAFLNDRKSHIDTVAETPLIQVGTSYSRIVLQNGKYIPTTKEDQKRPVTGVNYYGAQAYCEWAGGKLPTQSQWQYAARGGPKKSTSTFSGSDSANDVAVYFHNTPKSYPDTVGTKKPNHLGIYDMSGNVYEWCTNNDSNAVKAVLMGGSFNRGQTHCTVQSVIQNRKKSHKSPQDNKNDLGFRMLRTAIPLDGQG